jgi:signal transduction histidine kinase
MVSMQDRHGRIWFGFANCLARFNAGAETFERFVHDAADPFSLSNNMVMALHEDRQGNLWIGTAAGLNRLEELPDGTTRFVRYGRGAGMPADFIVSIVEHDDALWLGTDRGILRFRQTEGRVDARLYDTSDGLHVTAHHHLSALCDSEGCLVFGGWDGFDRFLPEKIAPDASAPRVVLTDLLLFNRHVPIIPDEYPTGDTLSLVRSITSLQELTLTHRHLVVTFRYSALHFRQPDKLRYAYMLAGFDREWIDAGSKTEATYTNLDPGDYTFRVKAMNADGIWSDRPAELAIHVEPPPWRTWWAHSLYLAAGAGAIALFTRSRIAARERELQEQRRLEQARLEERESIRRQNASDFHDEAGTTLTRILFLSELARRHSDGNGELRSLLEKIDTNATRLSQGMRDFIWVLDPDKDTLLDTLQRISIFGESLYAQSDTTFTMQYDNVQLRDVTLDLNQRRQVLMICKEALHNAARHAGAGAVVVRAACDGERLQISIEDDGCGFDASNGSTGYGLKSMRSRAENVEAELTVSSRSDAGTAVVLRLACQDRV